MTLISALCAGLFARWLSYWWFSGHSGWPLFGQAAAVGAFSTAAAVALAIAGGMPGSIAAAGVMAGARKGVAGASAVALTGAVAGAGAVAGTGAVTGALALAGGVAGASVVGAAVFAGAAIAAKVAARGEVAVVGLGAVVAAVLALLIAPALAAGMILRGLFFRVTATLRHVLVGVQRLPENWRENNFVVDSCLPAEFIPGIRDVQPEFALDGLTSRMNTNRPLSMRMFTPFVGFFLFLPAFLYRLNIKATAWFWWPLAYLLRPAPVADAESQQKQALCWPWTNPFQKALILVTALLALLSFTLHFADLVSWGDLPSHRTLPLPLKVALATGWERLAPWYWAQWLIALAGAGMLALAGHARSQDRNGNWRDYWQRSPWHLPLMIGLQRVRVLATGALLLMVFGALVLQYLQDPSSKGHDRVPEGSIAAFEHFYRTQK
ncbi:MAG TPA: hypothetical protein PLX89_20705 [Verrucomicrobiota bacterium]|nr:hypothetical protein [Verrucomicrobiota bacterium]